MRKITLHIVAREITHVAAQNVHEYVWCVKWDQVERKGWLERSNSHPPDRESCLTSGLPMRWRACKLPHSAIDTDVVFWYHYLSPAWMHRIIGGFESWWRTTINKIGCRTAKKDCCKQKGIHRKKLWELLFSV